MKKNFNNKKRLLFIVTRKFWPTNSGHEVVLYNYCRCLSELFNYDIYVYCFSEEKIDDKPMFIKEVRKAPKIKVLTKLKNIILNVFLINKWPLQIALYQNKYCFNDIKEYCMYVKPVAVYFDMVRLSMYKNAVLLETRKILMMDDILSKRYRRQIKANNGNGNIFGYYNRFMPKFITGIFSNNLLKNFILNFEAKRMEKWEIDSCSKFDCITLVSQKETMELQNKTLKDNIICVPMVVEDKYFSNGINSSVNDLVFVGNFNYAPNVDSLAYIVDKVIPNIKKEVTINIIGKCPDIVKKRYLKKSFVHFLGRVEDLKAAVQSSLIFVAPIVYGTGIKTKIIEAMAMGMPVVTNEVGAEGINAKRDEAFIVRDNAHDIASAIDMLIENKDLCLKMGKNASEYIRKNHSWQNMYEAFIKLGM